MDDDALVGVSEGLPRPLCRGYLVVLFEAIRIQMVEEGAAACDRTLRWALGILPDGQYEVLGAWHEPTPGRHVWPQIFNDLKVRGVDKLRFVASDESADLQAALNGAYPAATVLQPIQYLETGSAMPPRCRRFLRVGVDAMHLLQRRAMRVLARHSRFSDMADATAFVVAGLERAERSLEKAGAL